MVPRNYIANLEAQIASLANENEQLRARPLPQASTPTSAQSTQHEVGHTSPMEGPDWMSSSLGRISCEPPSQPHFLGDIALAGLVKAAIQVKGSTSVFSTERVSDQIYAASYTPASQASLPPQHAAEYLVEVYFQYQLPHHQNIERFQVEQAIESAYQSQNNQQAPNRDASRHIFTAHIIFVIALCNVHHPSGDRQPQSVECFHSAIGEL